MIKIISDIILLMKKFFENMFETVICYNGDFTQIFPKKGEEIPLILNSKKQVYEKKKKIYSFFYVLIVMIFVVTLWFFTK